MIADVIILSYTPKKGGDMAEERKEIVAKKKEVPVKKEKEVKDVMKKDMTKKVPAVKKEEKKEIVRLEGSVEIIEDDGSLEVKPKTKQVRYIFKSEKGWFEKERDNVRVTKYYRTQKEAIEAAKTHIKNSGLPGSIVIQSKTGKIRANSKVSAKAPAKK